MGARIQCFNNSGGGLVGRRGEIIVTAMGGQAAVPIDLYLFTQGAGIGLLCNIEQGGAADYDVEFSGCDTDTPEALKWWNKHDVLNGKTANAQSNLAYPVTMVRIFLRSLQGVLNFGIVVPDK